MRNIPLILLWIWQLPQHLLALVIWIVFKPESCMSYKGCKIFRVKPDDFGISLGRYIFISSHYQMPTVMHEYGHSIQSRWLGPIYMLIILFPSFIFCFMRDLIFHHKWDMTDRIDWYYKQPIEKHADILGGVDRAVFDYE